MRDQTTQTGEANLRRNIRLLKFISAGAIVVQTGESEGADSKVTLETLDRSKRLAVPRADFQEAFRRNWIVESKNCLKRSELGKAALIRLLHPDDGFSRQHDHAVATTMVEGKTAVQVTRSRNESPLDRLRFTSNRSGQAYLQEAEYEAGQRFRRDFEKSGLQPSVTQNWQSLGMAGRGTNGNSEMSDLSIDARRRLQQALDVLGPDLSGVAMDICCFLKGLETVERERKWPQRSAKLMLKTALCLLVRHYGMNAGAGSKSSAIRAWGAEDYRPSV